MLRWIGWAFVEGSCLCALVMADADRRLQAFRLPSQPRSAYWVVPLRIRRELYKPEGGYLVTRAWRACGLMWVLFVIAAVILSVTGPSLPTQ
jgi:hypothetical protein